MASLSHFGSPKVSEMHFCKELCHLGHLEGMSITTYKVESDSQTLQ